MNQARSLGAPVPSCSRPEDNLQGVPEHELRFAIQSGRAEDSRWHIRKDGSRFWANGVMVGLRDEAGTVTGVAKIIRDDTELKRSEELLQYQLNLADAIASNAAEGLVLVDKEGRLTFINPSAQSMFGWSQGELEGELLHDRLRCRAADGNWLSSEECPHMKVLSTGETLRSEEDFFLHKDGRLIPISSSIAPIPFG